MMRRALFALLISASTAAIAAERPPVGPVAPTEVTYRVLNQQSAVPANFTVLFAPFARAARVSFAGQPGYLLVNTAAHSVTMVIDQPKMSITIPTPAYLAPYFDWRDSLSFTPGPLAAIAGQMCQRWTTHNSRGTGQVCLTDDGVPLSIDAFGTNGDRAQIEAVTTSQVAFDPTDFQVPADHPMLGVSGAGATPLSPFGSP